MITKLSTFSGVSLEGEPLVRVFHRGDSIKKVAGAMMPEIQEWLSGYTPEKGKIATLVNAMGASEFYGQNSNGDWFSQGSLVHDCRMHAADKHPRDSFTGKIVPPYGSWTFYNAHPFAHHKNKDPSRAFGSVVKVCWNPRMRRVELVVVLDRSKAMKHGAQHIVDQIDAGEYPEVSMGCRVPYDTCLVCGNKSKTRNDYCSCIKHMGMGKILDDGRRIGVDNPHPRFFDISFVFIGADKTAKMMCKLGSGLWVPQSVADGLEVYGDVDSEGLVKAASSAGGYYLTTKGTLRLYDEDTDGKSTPWYKDPASKEDLEFKNPSNWGRLLRKSKVEKSKDRRGRDWTVHTLDIPLSAVKGDPMMTHWANRASEWSGDEGAAQWNKVKTAGQSIPEFYAKRKPSPPVEDPERKAAHVRNMRKAEEDKLLLGREDPQSEHSAVSDGTLHTNFESPEDQTKMAGFRTGVADLKSLNLPSDQYVVHASGPMAAKGIRDSKDLDVLVTKQLFNSLASKLGVSPKTAKSGTGRVLEWKNIEFFDELSHGAGDPIKNSETVGGIQMAPLSEIRRWKSAMGRPKDLKDVELIDNYLSKGAMRKMSALDLALLFKKSKKVKIGPPPKPNRKKYPFTGTIEFRGLTIHVENKPGSVREGVGPSGKKWSTKMHCAYGEFLKTRGVDGDKLDVYVGPYKSAENVHIVHQNFPTGHPRAGKYDEDKVMVGFRTSDEAKAAYLAHYDNPSFFRSITTMAFPLFRKAILKKEVHGEKVASYGGLMEKVAAEMTLEDLFDSASTEGSRRRQRRWRNFDSGKEVKVTGSGLSCKEKTASADLAFTPEDLLKMSEMKEAYLQKWSDIVKQIGPSRAVGKVTELLGAREPTLPKSVTERLGKSDLREALATPSLMGMVLKPREFQHVLLHNRGEGELADRLFDTGICFGDSDREEPPCEALESGALSSDLLKMLLPFLEGKSYLGPVLRRRILRITISVPSPEKERVTDHSPLLSKVASAYTWYRREQMKLAADTLKVVPDNPELHSAVFGVRDEDLFKLSSSPQILGKNMKPISVSRMVDPKSMAVVLGSIPLALMYSSHLRNKRGKEDIGLLRGLIADHPWITSAAAAAGMREIMKSPQAQQLVAELAGAGKRVWHGNPNLK